MYTLGDDNASKHLDMILIVQTSVCTHFDVILLVQNLIGYC